MRPLLNGGTLGGRQMTIESRGLVWRGRLERALSVLSNLGADIGAGQASASLPSISLQDAERDLGRSVPALLRTILTTVAPLQGHWQLPDQFEDKMPAESCGVLWGGVDLSVQEMLAAETSRRGWVSECFPDPADPYDAIWHDKFAFHTVANGDCIAIADGDGSGAVFYLSHDDGEGHGLELAPSVPDFLDRWSSLGFAGPEDWLLLPFIGDDSRALDAFGAAADNWRRALGLEGLGPEQPDRS
jgi:hypothetical protein